VRVEDVSGHNIITYAVVVDSKMTCTILLFSVLIEIFIDKTDTKWFSRPRSLHNLFRRKFLFLFLFFIFVF
jgi:hypothetical protein